MAEEIQSQNIGGGETVEINPFEIIGRKQVQIELLESRLRILAQGFKDQEVTIMELRLRVQELEPDKPGENSNGKKENAADILAELDKPL